MSRTVAWNVFKIQRKLNNQREMGKFLLTFVRHGETEYNRKALLQGQIDIPLNETGLKQAHALGRYLARERFDRVYSSDLSRCVQTAEGVIRNAAVPRPNIVKDARLRERAFGEAEGRSREEIKKAKTNQETLDPVGAETRKQVVDRGLSFIHDLCIDVHKEYGNGRDYCSKMAAGSYSAEDEKNIEEDQKEIEEGDLFEVVFDGQDENASADGACSSGIMQNSIHRTVVDLKKDIASVRSEQEASSGTTQNTSAETSLNSLDLQTSTTSEAIGGTATVGSDSKTLHSSIFKSDITGISNVPPYCPHIFVSSHGYILRALFQTLQKQYKIGFPGGNSILRSRCPNTGLSTFVFTLDSDGILSDVECYFVYAINHLEGIDFILV